jgi:adenine deaminase
MPRKAVYENPAILAAQIAVARGAVPAERVIRGAQYLDVFAGVFREGDVAIHGGVVVGIGDSYQGHKIEDGRGAFVVPGFIDAHVHVESSLLTPGRFQQAVLPRGTTTAIWDPHEIANVAGRAGIAWALYEAESLALDLFVMVPSCVPATPPAAGLETGGAELRAEDLREFRGHPRVLGLAELMNFPGLLRADAEVLAKLDDWKGLGRDGHCPGLGRRDLSAYAVAGIGSCHESTTLDEAREKLTKGIHVLVREGSCAKDADALLPLLDAYSSAVIGFCTDDRNPADIAAEGHVSAIVDRALRRGLDPAAVFRAAAFAPARLYGLDDRGAVAPGYWADLVLCRPRGGDSWTSGLQILATFKRGEVVDETQLDAVASGRAARPFGTGRNLHVDPVSAEVFALAAPAGTRRVSVRVIEVIPRQILTRAGAAELAVVAGQVPADPGADLLKIAVIERHHGSNRRGLGFVRGFGLARGAIATSINHDCHNLIVVGASEALMAAAVNRLLEIDGGIVVVHADGTSEALPLPIAGLMTDAAPGVVTAALLRLKALAARAGCTLAEPFLQLSFLALPVIPALKITDRGLVDVAKFALTPLWSEDQPTL